MSILMPCQVLADLIHHIFLLQAFLSFSVYDKGKELKTNAKKYRLIRNLQNKLQRDTSTFPMYAQKGSSATCAVNSTA